MYLLVTFLLTRKKSRRSALINFSMSVGLTAVCPNVTNSRTAECGNCTIIRGHIPFSFSY
jgi:hypothetical protein